MHCPHDFWSTLGVHTGFRASLGAQHCKAQPHASPEPKGFNQVPLKEGFHRSFHMLNSPIPSSTKKKKEGGNSHASIPLILVQLKRHSIGREHPD